MVCNFSPSLPASKAWQRILILIAMFFGLVSVGAFAYYYMVVNDDYMVVACIATIIPSLILVIGTYAYLRVNWVNPDVFAQPALPRLLPTLKKKVLLYLSVGFMLGVPAVYVIMSGVKQNIFTISFPVVYIIGLSVASIGFLPNFLTSTGAIAPVRYFVLLVSLTIILLKVGVYIDSYFPGNLDGEIPRMMFFALGVANWLLILMLHASWHQVFTMEVPPAVSVSVPLNVAKQTESTVVQIVHVKECECNRCNRLQVHSQDLQVHSQDLQVHRQDLQVSADMKRQPPPQLTIPRLDLAASNVSSPADSLTGQIMAL